MAKLTTFPTAGVRFWLNTTNVTVELGDGDGVGGMMEVPVNVKLCVADDVTVKAVGTHMVPICGDGDITYGPGFKPPVNVPPPPDDVVDTPPTVKTTLPTGFELASTKLNVQDLDPVKPPEPPPDGALAWAFAENTKSLPTVVPDLKSAAISTWDVDCASKEKGAVRVNV